jgi:hypothetical protein
MGHAHLSGDAGPLLSSLAGLGVRPKEARAPEVLACSLAHKAELDWKDRAQLDVYRDFPQAATRSLRGLGRREPDDGGQPEE